MSRAILECTGRALRAAAMFALFTTTGCSLEPGGEPTHDAPYDDDAVASVQIALESVPTGTRCVRISILGATSIVRSFDLTAGQSTAALDLGRLSAGSTTFAATAYNVTCASVTTATIADWVGSPVTAIVLPGVNPAVSLTLVPNVTTTVAVDFKQPVTRLAAGTASTFALLPNGTVSAWGSNQSGVLGDGTTTGRLTPGVSAPLTNIASIASSSNVSRSSCAVTRTGALQCWGENWGGQLGTGSTGPQLSPVTVISSGISQVVLGEEFSCALRASDKRPLCAGRNNQNQLGLGAGTTVIQSNTFQPISTTLKFTQIEASSTAACGIIEAGNVVCWGENIARGDGSTSGSSATPTASPIEGIVELAFGGRHFCGLRGDGSVWCWGNNNYGQLGDGTTTNRFTAGRVSNVSGAVQIASAEHSTCARLSNETVKCWGAGMGNGAVGDGSGMQQATAVTVRNLSGAVAIAAGRNHVCAQLASGDLQCWGANADGQLGDGTTAYRLTPVSVQW